jgi:hypothetical protein
MDETKSIETNSCQSNTLDSQVFSQIEDLIGPSSDIMPFEDTQSDKAGMDKID